MMLVLGSYKVIRFLYLSARILKVYKEVLTGFNTCPVQTASTSHSNFKAVYGSSFWEWGKQAELTLKDAELWVSGILLLPGF